MESQGILTKCEFFGTVVHIHIRKGYPNDSSCRRFQRDIKGVAAHVDKLLADTADFMRHVSGTLTYKLPTWTSTEACRCRNKSAWTAAFGNGVYLSVSLHLHVGFNYDYALCSSAF
eukprot:5309440-Amphidinium_carterae.1